VDEELSYSSRAQISPAKPFLVLLARKDGTLTLANGRLSFETDKGQTLFDVPLGSVRHIKEPRLGAGEILLFTIEGKRYPANFGPPAYGSSALAIGQYKQRKDVAQNWAALLLGKSEAEDAFEHHPRPSSGAE
jgi:hypothetical protein